MAIYSRDMPAVFTIEIDMQQHEKSIKLKQLFILLVTEDTIMVLHVN